MLGDSTASVPICRFPCAGHNRIRKIVPAGIIGGVPGTHVAGGGHKVVDYGGIERSRSSNLDDVRRDCDLINVTNRTHMREAPLPVMYEWMVGRMMLDIPWGKIVRWSQIQQLLSAKC